MLVTVQLVCTSMALGGLVLRKVYRDYRLSRLQEVFFGSTAFAAVCCLVRRCSAGT